MGDAKRTPAASTEARMKQAEEVGWQGFLAKVLAGNSITNNDYTRALLGLGKEKERLEDRFVKFGERVAALVTELRNQIVTALVREEIMAAHLHELAAWRSLPWWRRWRTPRPTMPPFPALPPIPQAAGEGPPTLRHPSIPPQDAPQAPQAPQDAPRTGEQASPHAPR